MLIPKKFDRLRVVLVGTRNPLSIGAAARAMSNFGFQHLCLVHPYDVAFREARSAVGASKILTQAEEFKTLAEAVRDCSSVVGTTALGHRRLLHVVQGLQAGASLISEKLMAAGSEHSGVALVFGSEKFGLSKEDLSHCHWLMHVPMYEEHTSMNLGQAVAVCLYELVRGTEFARPQEKTPMAKAEELERVTAAWLHALRASGSIHAETADAKEEAVRRMVHRLHLSPEDAAAWLGMLRQINWKLEKE